MTEKEQLEQILKNYIRNIVDIIGVEEASKLTKSDDFKDIILDKRKDFELS